MKTQRTTVRLNVHYEDGDVLTWALIRYHTDKRGLPTGDLAAHGRVRADELDASDLDLLSQLLVRAASHMA